MDWDENEILKFIESYEQNYILWDPKHKSHYNKKLRNKSWDDIAEKNNKSVEKCKKKLASLLATMRRERSKMRKNLLAGKGYRSTWFAFEKFRFLWGRSKLHEPSKNESQEITNTENCTETTLDNEETANYTLENDICLEDVDEAALENPSDDDNSFILSPLIQLQSTEPLRKRIPNKKSIINRPTFKRTKFGHVNSVTKAINTLIQELTHKIEVPQLPEDEFDVFGKMVAVHLRQLSLSNALECQSEILHYLVQKRLGRNPMLSDINAHYSQFVPTPCISPVPSNTSCSNFVEEVSNNDVESSTNNQMIIKMESIGH